MSLWEIQDGCHFQLRFWPILGIHDLKVVLFEHILYNFINFSVLLIQRTCLSST